MILSCHMLQCPWHTGSNFCSRPMITINQSGLCMTIYNRQNSVNPNWQQEAKKDKEELERLNAEAGQKMIETSQDKQEVQDD